MPDTRIAYGARCTWWDSIDKVGSKGDSNTGLPCCPHCGGVLFEVSDEATWWADVDRHEAQSTPGYRVLIEWGRGRCFPGFPTLVAEHEAAIA